MSDAGDAAAMYAKECGELRAENTKLRKSIYGSGLRDERGRETNDKISHIKMLAETDFIGACVWAENNVQPLRDFF